MSILIRFLTPYYRAQALFRQALAARASLTPSTARTKFPASTPLAVSHPIHPGMNRALGRFRFWRTEGANSDTCRRRLLQQALPPDRARERPRCETAADCLHRWAVMHRTFPESMAFPQPGKVWSLRQAMALRLDDIPMLQTTGRL